MSVTPLSEILERVSKVPHWEGAYYQFNRTPMEFEYFKIGEDGIVRGEGSDTVGKFTLSGMLLKTPYSDIQFVKRYHSAHSVLYSGSFDPENGWFRGFWDIYSGGGFAMTDRFELIPVDTKPTKANIEQTG